MWVHKGPQVCLDKWGRQGSLEPQVAMGPAEKTGTEEALVCQGHQDCLVPSDLKGNLDLWGPLDRPWSGPLEPRERREPLEALLETWWGSREPKGTEDCPGRGARRVKLAVLGSLETLGKTVRKGHQDRKATRVTQELASKGPLGPLVPRALRETLDPRAAPVLLVLWGSLGRQALVERRVSLAL